MATDSRQVEQSLQEEDTGVEAKSRLRRLSLQEQQNRVTPSTRPMWPKPSQQQSDVGWSFARDDDWRRVDLEQEVEHSTRQESELRNEDFGWSFYDNWIGAEREGGQSKKHESEPSDKETFHNSVLDEESWSRRGGWDEIQSTSSTSDLNWGNLGDTADDVDLGYVDQELVILGENVQVRVAYTRKGVEDWIQQCSSANERHFGIDIEWQPNHRKGDDNPAALVQIAGKRGCLIVQLLYIDGIPDSLEEFCADAKVQLAGVGVREDVKKLFQDYGLRCEGVIDLGSFASQVLNRTDLKRAGLAALCTSVLGIPFQKNKSVTLSNWAVEGLSLPQITYAAGDAYVAYSVLVSLLATDKERRLWRQELPRYNKG